MEAQQQLIPAGALDVVASQVDTEWNEIVQMWLHGRPESTCSIYEPEIRVFRRRVPGKRLCEVTLADLQQWAVDLFANEEKPRTVARKLSTAKSLLTFAHRIGMLSFNVGAALRIPSVPNDLAEKILTEAEIRKIIEQGSDAVRDQVMLRLMYGTGIRAAEVAGLRWIDCAPREKAGQITVLGKGNRTRSIVVSPMTWKAILSIRPAAARPDDPVFTQRNGKPMDRTSVTCIVRRAARRVGLEAAVSSHWLRHAHATHSLDHGAPLPLIQQTLGHASLETTQRYLHIRPEDSSSRFLNA
jgi:integrase/recombinase XerD